MRVFATSARISYDMARLVLRQECLQVRRKIFTSFLIDSRLLEFKLLVLCIGSALEIHVLCDRFTLP